MSPAEAILDAVDHEPPGCWSRDPDEARKQLFAMARRWGVLVALGQITVDEGYLLVHRGAEGLQTATAGAVPWRDAMTFATWVLDQWSVRISDHLRLQEYRQLRGLKRLAVGLLEQGAVGPAVRKALADAARQYDPPPPVDILAEAYQAAISECRSNDRWLRSRAVAG